MTDLIERVALVIAHNDTNSRRIAAKAAIAVVLRHMAETAPNEDWEHPHQFIRQIASENGVSLDDPN